MTDKVFLDTNLWVYFYTQNPQEKYQAVADLISSAGRSLTVSTQVLGELYNVLTRKKLFSKTDSSNIV